MASEHWICRGFSEVMADPKTQPQSHPQELRSDGVTPACRGVPMG